MAEITATSSANRNVIPSEELCVWMHAIVVVLSLEGQKRIGLRRLTQVKAWATQQNEEEEKFIPVLLYTKN